MTHDMKPTEDKLSRTLAVVAEQTSIRSDWTRVADDVHAMERRPRSWHRPRTLAAAAVAVLVMGGVLVAVRSGNNQTESVATAPNLVFPGETVLSADPLIVVAAVGPEPEFDTSDLGTRIEFDPITELTPELEGLITSRRDRPGSKLVKATLLGELRGEPWLITVIDTPDHTDPGLGGSGHLRDRMLGNSSGASGTGGFVDPDSLEMIEVPRLSETPVPGITSGSTGSVIWDGLPSEVAVATLVGNGQRMWTTPRSGVAVFPAEIENGERYAIQAFSLDGELLREDETLPYPVAGRESPPPGP